MYQANAILSNYPIERKKMKQKKKKEKEIDTRIKKPFNEVKPNTEPIKEPNSNELLMEHEHNAPLFDF